MFSDRSENTTKFSQLNSFEFVTHLLHGGSPSLRRVTIDFDFYEFLKIQLILIEKS